MEQVLHSWATNVNYGNQGKSRLGIIGSSKKGRDKKGKVGQ